MLKWIEKYLNLGWSLIPIEPRGKTPLISWKPYQTKRATIDEIRQWLERWPQMNLGGCTGELSKIVVVDFDGTEGLKSMRSSIFPPSAVTSVSGNGKQAFYKWIKPVTNSVKQLAPGVDVRGDGGFVVLPPSIHPNGKIYRWEKFVPQGLVPISLSTAEVNTAPTIATKPEGWIAKALEEMKIGNIDTTLTSICGRLRHDGYSDTDCLRLLEPHALASGATRGHLEEKIRNVWSRYEPKQTINRDSSITSSGDLSIHSPSDADSIKQFLDYKSSVEVIGIETGFPTLDKFLRGGFKSERLFTVAATTGTGKTNFSVALSQNLCLQDKKVLYFSTEFKYEKLWSWYAERLGLEEFKRQSFYVCDAYNPNIEQIEQAVIKYTPDIVIFDYIQHLGKEKEILTKFMRDFQFLQRKYNFQGVVVAQLNRMADAYEDGKKVEPRMSMIEGSATIEQASSRVLLLDKVKESPEYNEIIGYLTKNDNGETGRIVFGLYKNPYHFREII